MASFVEELFTWVNAQTWKPGDIQFDVQPLKPPYPFFTMVPIGDAGVFNGMCATDAGQTVVQFNGYGTDRYTLYGQMDTFRKNLWSVLNSIPGFHLWDVRITGITGYGTEDELVYRYSLEITNIWEVI